MEHSPSSEATRSSASQKITFFNGIRKVYIVFKTVNLIEPVSMRFSRLVIDQVPKDKDISRNTVGAILLLRTYSLFHIYMTHGWQMV
jgi:hypothetical protein